MQVHGQQLRGRGRLFRLRRTADAVGALLHERLRGKGALYAQPAQKIIAQPRPVSNKKNALFVFFQLRGQLLDRKRPVGNKPDRSAVSYLKEAQALAPLTGNERGIRHPRICFYGFRSMKRQRVY